jgi:hypothetical protein
MRMLKSSYLQVSSAYLIRCLTLCVLTVFLNSCKVTFIAGYDPTIESTVTKLQRDFNLYFIKFSRTIQDTNPSNQNYVNFQDYYDNMNADLQIIQSRSKYLGKKSDIVKKQIENLRNTLLSIEKFHKETGFKDNPADDRHDIRDAANSSFEAVIRLQEELKPKK